MKIVIILLLIIIIIYLIYILLNNREKFNNNNKVADIVRNLEKDNNLIYRILPSITDFTSKIDCKSIQNHLTNYLGVYIPNKGSVDNNLIYTRSLKSNSWYGPLENDLPSSNTIITQLTYNNDNRLMCIGLSEDKYNIYIKETKDILSKWNKLKQPDNIHNLKISYIIHDINSSKLIGINNDNGQLYIKETSELDSIWIGPINYDIPMKAIYFYKNEFLIGIGKVDNYIYIKKGRDWTKHQWDNNNINKTYVYDLIFDIDGCMIATSPDGIIKQTDMNFFSQFKPINITHVKERRLDFNDIMYYKTGCKYFNKHKINKLNPSIKDIIDKKKKVLKSCKKMRYLEDNNSMEETDSIIMNNFKLSNNINFLLNNLNYKL